jgi:hypothetical protein
MTAPGNGATVAGNVVVTATASDDVAVAGVQFKLDGANVGAEVTSAPYTIVWNSRTTGNGAHTLTAVGRDSSGKSTTATAVSVTVNNDLTPPTVSVTTPINGATVSSGVGIVASASDNVGVAGVQLKINGFNFGPELTSPPYSLTWDSTSVVNGSYAITAVARDAAGNTTTSAAVNVTVNNVIDTTPPTVSVTSPVNAATVSGAAVAIVASASDNVGVIGVQFLVDGIAVGAEDTSAPYSIVWDSLSVANGAHTLTARARDLAGLQTTSAPISVTVSNATGPGVLAVDVMVFTDESERVTSVTSPTFSTTAGNELLLAFVAFDDLTPGNALTAMSGAGLTWTRVVKANAQRGGTEIWRAFAPNPLTNVSVTATIAQPTPSSLSVVTFTGVDTSGTGGSGAIGATKSASAATGAPNTTITTTRANSWVWAVTVGSGQTLLHEYLYWGGATFWMQRRVATTPTPGSVQINDTAPTDHQWNLSVVEIRPRP